MNICNELYNKHVEMRVWLTTHVDFDRNTIFLYIMKKNTFSFRREFESCDTWVYLTHSNQMQATCSWKW